MHILAALISIVISAQAAIAPSFRATNELKRLKLAGAQEFNGSYSLFQRRGSVEFVQQMRLDPESGQLLSWAFRIPPGSGAYAATASLAVDQEAPVDSAWVTIVRGVRQMDFGVRQINGKYYRIQSRLADPRMSVHLDPRDGRHLIVRSDRDIGHFYASENIRGEIVGFQFDRVSLAIQTSAGYSYLFTIRPSGTGTLSFEPRGARLIGTRELQAETHLYLPSCEILLL